MALLWRHLIRYAPEILEMSRHLLKKSQAKETKEARHADLADQVRDLSARLDRIEENEKVRAELTQKMAEQAQHLAEGLRTVAFRSLAALGVATAALVLSAILLVLLLGR